MEVFFTPQRISFFIFYPPVIIMEAVRELEVEGF
jgi:hypothetical protein